jgi:hypothetical protein
MKSLFFLCFLFLFTYCSLQDNQVINGEIEKPISIEIIAEIGTEDQPFEYQLGQPVAVRTDEKGHIYIADRASMTIKVFDENGSYLSSFGGRGRGPGEFQEINFMEITPDGNLYFLDRGKLEYIFLSKNGDYISSFPIRIQSNTLQYYPHQVAWYEDKTIGIRKNSALITVPPPPLDRPLFHIFSTDFQNHIESFFSFRDLGYSEDEHFIWNIFGWIPGSFMLNESKKKFIYSPGVYTGALYEFENVDNNWKIKRTLEGIAPSLQPFDIYTSNEEFETFNKFPGTSRIFYGGSAYMGRLYSVNAGIFYLNNGNVIQFYGEWNGGNMTLEEGNTLDIYAQLFDRNGKILRNGYVISIERDTDSPHVLVNWKDEFDNFYLLNLSSYGVPTVKKFRLDL